MRTWFDLKPEGCFVIAEVAQAHDGSLGAAHSYIDAAASAGADAVKFQTHIAAAESTPHEPWRLRFSPQDETRYDYWRRMEFTPHQWAGLAEHARARNLVFLSSAFSNEAVDLLQKLEIPAWKVGAGEITNLDMIDRMATTGKPVLLSSGLASWAALDAAVETVRRRNAPVAVFQCTTQYPCPPEKLGLNLLPEIKHRYNCPTGLSDHSGTIYAGLAAVALAADALEVHITFSRESFGPDVPASLTLPELADLVRGIRFIETALANSVDKDQTAAELSPLLDVFGKSVVAAHDLAAGDPLNRADLALKKPGTGLPACRMNDLIGRTLRHDITADTLLKEDDFVPQQ